MDAGNYDVVVYNGKQQPRESNQRLAVFTFKTDKGKSEKELEGKPNPNYDPSYKRPDARCVSVPKLTLSVTPQILSDALSAALEDLQDAVMRTIVVAAIDEGKNVITLMDSQINFEAIAEYAKQQAAGGKINKELIDAWFDEDLADQLTLALASAMKIPEGSNPTAEQEKRIADGVNNYKEVFKLFSAPKAGVSPKIATQMHKALEKATNKEHRVYKSLALKLAAHMEKQDPVLLGL
jgi:hypothetical protein